MASNDEILRACRDYARLYRELREAEKVFFAAREKLELCQEAHRNGWLWLHDALEFGRVYETPEGDEFCINGLSGLSYRPGRVKLTDVPEGGE